LPFNWPALLLIFTKPTMPKTIAGIAVIKQVKGARAPSMSDAIANGLVLASGFGVTIGTFVRIRLQERQNWALSGFSAPHFGQYIFCSPILTTYKELKVKKQNLSFLNFLLRGHPAKFYKPVLILSLPSLI
jgi:hypothetical protein